MIKIMHKYGIDKIPQLLNVIRGEMFLFGFSCWTLKDAISLSKVEQSHLNTTPAIICLSSAN
jgi:lipopolysaccharide/colanic/teichoic acid biosynthesis glycosyltransferase